MNKKTGMNIIIGGVSLAMVASMILPGMLGNSGGGNPEQDAVVIKVNDTEVTSKMLDQFRRADHLYSMAGEDFEGLIGDDLKTLMVRKLVDTQLVFNDAKDLKVNREEVNKEVKGIREQNNLQKNDQWTRALANNGFTDASFREEIRKQLATNKRRDQLFEKAPAITDEQAKFYYNLNKEEYMGEPRVVGRKIVVKDKALAEKLRKEAKADADFAQLATKNSLEDKDRGGALGAVKDGKISSVSLITLPEKVSAEVKKLENGGLTDVIENSGKFYIVKVEEYIKAKAKPFDQVKKDVKDSLKEAREAKIYTDYLADLRKDAKIEYVDQKWKVSDPIVGKVVGKEIPYSEVLLQVYGNQQVANLLRQMPPEQAIGLINASMKPGLTGQVIEGYAAPKIAKDLNLSVVGPGPLVVQILKNYSTRDVKINDEEVKDFYNKNKDTFKTAASAVIKEINFNDKAKAEAFRKNYDGQADLIEAAAQAGGTVSERGQVGSDTQIDPKLSGAALEGDLRKVGNVSLSAVVPLGQRFALAEVSELKPKEIKPFDEVSGQIRQQLLTEKKAKVADEFIEKKTEALKPVNDLPKVLKAQKTRVEAADKARKAAKEAEKAQEEKKETQADNKDKASEKTESSKDQKESSDNNKTESDKSSDSEESNAARDQIETAENTENAEAESKSVTEEQDSENKTDTTEKTEE